MENIRAAIIGGSQCGKTFRAAGYARGFWRGRGLRSLVFDPWKGETNWGEGAWVTPNFETWRRVVTNTSGCVAIWDEATTHGGDDDDENAGFFSEIRHRHPAIFALGHCHSAIGRKLRVNLTDLFLALSDDVDAMLWARTMKDPELRNAANAAVLPRFHFMHKKPYQPVKILSESADAIRAGILP